MNFLKNMVDGLITTNRSFGTEFMAKRVFDLNRRVSGPIKNFHYFLIAVSKSGHGWTALFQVYGDLPNLFGLEVVCVYSTIRK